MALYSHQNQKHDGAVKAVEKSHRKIILMLWMLMSTIGLLLFMQSFSFADEVQENLYDKHYKEQNPYQLKSADANPDTKMYVSNHKEEDNISMLENGYDMMGTSGFTAIDVSPDFALAHAKAIKADTVLVYTKYSSAKAQASRKAILKKKAEEEGRVFDEALIDEETVYDYFASYWAKIPMPTFGVHIVKLRTVMQDPETDEVKKQDERGLKILAVIKGSAAAKAEIMKSDSLLKIGDVDINEPKDLFAAVKKYKGQTVPVLVKRGEKEMTVQVEMVKQA